LFQTNHISVALLGYAFIVYLMVLSVTLYGTGSWDDVGKLIGKAMKGSGFCQISGNITEMCL
jgi:hypothetical protein